MPDEGENLNSVNAGGEPEASGTQTGPAYGEPGYRESVDFGRQERRKTAEFRSRTRNTAEGEEGPYHSRYDSYRFRTPDPDGSSGGNRTPGDGAGSEDASGAYDGSGTSSGSGPGGFKGAGDFFSPDNPEDKWKRILFGVLIAAVTVALAVVVITGVARVFRSGKSSGDKQPAAAVSQEAVIDETPEAVPGNPQEEDEAVSEKEEETAENEAEPAGEETAEEAGQEADEKAGEETGEEAAAPAGEENIEEQASDDTDSSGMTVQDVVRKVMPSMVSITNVSVQEYRSFNGLITSRDAVSSGSGFIVAITGDAVLIATNYHVIANAENITVAFADESTASGTVKGVDADSDLAVIEVSLADLEKETRDAISVITFGDSDSLEVGEPVIAIGNALGYGQSVSSGIVSALNRILEDSDGTMREMIQTDASINPGNSGGALLNMSGELVGINEIKYADTSVEGVGYAIPAAIARPIIERLMRSEKKEPVEEGKEAYLGVTIATVPEKYVKNGGYPAGACVLELTEGGPADKAGLMVNDIITSVEGSAVTSLEDLLRELSYYAAGDEIRVTVSRPDTEAVKFNKLSVTVTLGSRLEAVENGLMTEDGRPIEDDEETEEGGDRPEASGQPSEETPEAAASAEEETPEAPDAPSEEAREEENAPDHEDGSPEAPEEKKNDQESTYDFGGLFGGGSNEFNFKDFFR